MRREKRHVALKRRTRGTEVEIDLRLDGNGRSAIETPFGFLNHLLDLLVGHAGMDLKLVQTVNRHADDPYAIDDLATAFAEGLRRALGDRPRIRQFGNEILPVGDALVLAAVDLVSPPVFQLNANFRSRRIEEMDVALIERFLATFTDRLGACLHVRMLAGENDENACRAIFLAVGRSLAQAATEVERQGAREIAVDLDYLEGASQPEEARAEGEMEEAVVEEIEAIEPEAEEEPIREALHRGGSEDRGARRGPRGESGRRGELGRRGEAGRRSELGRRREGRGERPPMDRPPLDRAPEERLPGERLADVRGPFRERRGGRGLPELPDLPELPELEEVPELPDFEGFEPVTDVGEATREGRVSAADEESGVQSRRRRRGKRGGRGRRRGERPEPLAAEEVADTERASEAEAGNGRGGLLREEEEEEERGAERGRAREDLEQGSQPPAMREEPMREEPMRGEPLPALHFGRGRRSRVGRPGEAPEGSTAAPTKEEPMADVPPAPAVPPEMDAPPSRRGSDDDEVLDFISDRAEPRQAAAKPRRKRR